MIEEEEEEEVVVVQGRRTTEVTPLLLLSLLSAKTMNDATAVAVAVAAAAPGVDDTADTTTTDDNDDEDFVEKNPASPSSTKKATTGAGAFPKPIITPLYRLTVLAWFGMISFGLFATFQYVVPATIQSWWYFDDHYDDDYENTTTTSIISYQQERWEKTDPGLYRPSTSSQDDDDDEEQPTNNSGIANSLMLVHLTCGIYLMFVGPIQLVPYIRHNYINVHRWIGRCYILTAFVASTCATTWVLLFHTSRYWIHEDIGNITFGLAALVSSIQSYRYIRIATNISSATTTTTRDDDDDKNKDDYYTTYIQYHKLWSYRLFGVIFGAALYRIWSWPIYILGTAILPPIDSVDPHPLISVTFYMLFVPSWIVIELIYRGIWKPSEVVLQWSFGILLALLLPILCLTWIPAMFNLPTVQEQILTN